MEAKSSLIFLNVVSFTIILLLFISGKNLFSFIWYYFLQHIPLFQGFPVSEGLGVYADSIFDKAYRIILVLLFFNLITLIFQYPVKTISRQPLPVKAKSDLSKLLVDRVPIRTPIADSFGISDRVPIKDHHLSDLPFDEKIEQRLKLPLVLPQTRPYCTGVTLLPGREEMNESTVKSSITKPRLLSFAHQFDIDDKFYAVSIKNLKQWLVSKLLRPLYSEMIKVDTLLKEATLPQYGCLSKIFHLHWPSVADLSLKQVSCTVLANDYAIFLSAGKAELWLRRLQLELFLSPHLLFSSSSSHSHLELKNNDHIRSFIYHRIKDLSMLDNLSAFRGPIGAMDSTSPFIVDADIKDSCFSDVELLLGIFAIKMDLLMSPYFDESISTFSKYALDLFGYGMGLSSSSGSEYSSFGGYKRPLESYQSMIRQFPLQIVRSSPSSSNFLLVSLLDDTHYLSIDGHNHVFYVLVNFCIFMSKKYSGFLGNLDLSSRHVDLMSVIKQT
ncbi:hypothetical protein MDAP_000431 [Mitosporidium daphniae]